MDQQVAQRIAFLAAGATLSILSAALVLGCASLPSESERPAPRAASSYQSSRSFSAPVGDFPSDAWWKSYRDPQLDRLIQQGLAGSPTLAQAEARLRRAQAFQQVAGSALAPQVGASASATEQRFSKNYITPPAGTPDGWNEIGRATLDFSWEIDFWGKNRAALAAATSETEAARADAAQARIVLATSIASAYAELARLTAALETAVAAREVRARTAELFARRRDHGLENAGSVRQVESRRAAAEADVLALEESLALQRNRIAALLGAGPDRGLEIAPPAVDLSRPFGLPAELPAELLGRRADIVAARLRAEAAAQRIDQAVAGFYPNVNLGAFVGVQSLGFGRLLKAGSEIGSVGPAVSLPIFDGGRLRGQLGGAQAEYADAVAGYDRAVVQALQDVADAVASRESLAGQLGRMNDAVEAARDAWQTQNNRYQGGLASYLDVLSAEDGLLSALRTLTDLQSRSFSLDVALVRALGGGYQSN